MKTDKLTLSLRKLGSSVYYLSATGFTYGYVSTIYVNERTLEVTYRVKEKGDNGPFVGHDKKEHEVWDTYEEMLAYFKTLPLKK